MRLRKIVGRLIIALLPLATAGAYAADASYYGLDSALLGEAPRLTSVANVRAVATLTQIPNSRPQSARQEFDRGVVPDSTPLEHMQLVLKRSPAREAALDSFMEKLHDPASPQFHHWMTAEDYGTDFGVVSKDIDTLTAWLEAQGFTVSGVYPNKMQIDFSGTADKIRSAFHTEEHVYEIEGRRHIANASDIRLPASLTPVVAGVAWLHNFQAHPKNRVPIKRMPLERARGKPQNDLSPRDFATIYNVLPLWSSDITGKGQTIAVVEMANMDPQDWTDFRKTFALNKFGGKFSQIHPAPVGLAKNNCIDPGSGDDGETLLDAEWSGAVAPDANIVVASCAAQSADKFAGMDGFYAALTNIVNSKTPPDIISSSYGTCEADISRVDEMQVLDIWKQAAAQGISSFDAAGDTGSVSCNDRVPLTQAGLNVDNNGNSPYIVAVGGTDFPDVLDKTTAQYWNTDVTSDYANARSYMPETPWNYSCANSVIYKSLGYSGPLEFCNSNDQNVSLVDIGGSGGRSKLVAKPAWQKLVYGMPADKSRNLPDVALFAAWGDAPFHHGVITCTADTRCSPGLPKGYEANGGTSFAAPAFAGIQALVNQKVHGKQGNPNPVLYTLAAKEYGKPGAPNTTSLKDCASDNGNTSGNACVFHSVTRGNNAAPCSPGSADCYASAGKQAGIISLSTSKLQLAYPAAPGWNFATGLGSVDAANLVQAWSDYLGSH